MSETPRVKVVIAKVERDHLRPEILGVGTAPSHGLRRGMVVDMEETINDVATAEFNEPKRQPELNSNGLT